ncbi:MAG: PEGA domain-containing protein [Spirochaetota bacterium]
MKKFFILVVISITLIFMGCSTIMNGTSQMVSVNSDIEEADVLVNGNKVGKTPFSGKIKRSSKTVITVQKEGYSPVNVTPHTELPSAFWGNIILGGFFGSTTDYASGAVNEYTPNTFYVNLKKK